MFAHPHKQLVIMSTACSHGVTAAMLKARNGPGSLAGDWRLVLATSVARLQPVVDDSRMRVCRGHAWCHSGNGEGPEWNRITLRGIGASSMQPRLHGSSPSLMTRMATVMMFIGHASYCCAVKPFHVRELASSIITSRASANSIHVLRHTHVRRAG